MRFSTRLALLFGGLLALSMVGLMIVIDRLATDTVLRQIQVSLERSVQTVDDLHRTRVVNLQQKVRLVAADYGFKAAYASGDVRTIRSALENHQGRLANADLMVLADLDGKVIASTHAEALDGQAFPWMHLIDAAYDHDSAEATGFAVVDDAIVFLVVAPLLAPDVEAWIVSGFELDDAVARWLSAITRSDVTYINTSTEPPTLVASSLDTRLREGLAGAKAGVSIEHTDFEYRAAGETHIGHVLPFLSDSEPNIAALVQRSLDSALRPYRALQNVVGWILALSVLVVLVAVTRTARRVTGSLTELSRAATAVSRGDLEARVVVRRNDEIGQLAVAFNRMVEGLAEKERVRDLLGKVVSPEIANKLMADGVELGGEEREVTVLFCDLQGFTSLSERKPAAELVPALNEFFTGASQIIESHHGVIDKYIGDAIMAVFGAPQDDSSHARNAVLCGVDLCRSASGLVQALNSDADGNCRFGVGIHSGVAIAGNVGSTSRLNYTVIGDTVNVASRVEGQTRLFDVPLAITETTERLCDNLEFRHLGRAQLKGREKHIELYTVALD